VISRGNKEQPLNCEHTHRADGSLYFLVALGVVRTDSTSPIFVTWKTVSTDSSAISRESRRRDQPPTTPQAYDQSSMACSSPRRAPTSSIGGTSRYGGSSNESCLRMRRGYRRSVRPLTHGDVKLDNWRRIPGHKKSQVRPETRRCVGVQTSGGPDYGHHAHILTTTRNVGAAPLALLTIAL